AGAIGRSCLVPSDILPANANQAVAIIRPKPDNVNPRFLLYYLKSPAFLNHSLGRVVQTAQANVSLSVLAKAPVAVPPRPIQDAISVELGAFDALIENRERQVKILEDVARALYADWFMKFRFSGNKCTRSNETIAGNMPD